MIKTVNMKFCDINNIKISPRLGIFRNKQNLVRKFLFVTAFLLPFIHYGGSDPNRKIKQNFPLSFVSIQKVYKEEVGDSVLLLCKVNNLGDSIIVWKQPDRIISAGLSLIRKDVRMSLLEHSQGIHLQIRNLNVDDAGNYICEVENEAEPIQQTNQLQILVPPKISTSHSAQNLTVKKDSSLKLSCNASGFPSPTISWERQLGLLPSGEKRLESRSLELAHLKRSHSGRYICTADNKVGPPVSAFIDLHVIYEPEIEVDKSLVHGGLGQEAVISCIVYGDPAPSVRWYRDTMVLDRNGNRMMELFGDRHRLVIVDVGENDFGNYSCLAENELGRTRGYIELSGRPNSPEITSDIESLYSDQFNLTWTVESYAEITAYRIIYRKYLENTPVYDTRSRWHNIVLPDINLTPVSQPLALSQRANRQTASYVFFALEPNTKYEVRLQAKNLHGWSQFSEDFVFTTRSRGDVPKELPVETLHNSNDISDLKLSGKELGLVSEAGVLSQEMAYFVFLFLLCIQM